MCKKTNGLQNRIDPCIRTLIKILNKYLTNDIKIVACCCGHDKYYQSIIVKQMYASGEFFFWDICSDTIIPRKRKFYKKDKQGYYYIPELKKLNNIRSEAKG